MRSVRNKLIVMWVGVIAGCTPLQDGTRSTDMGGWWWAGARGKPEMGWVFGILFPAGLYGFLWTSVWVTAFAGRGVRFPGVPCQIIRFSSLLLKGLMVGLLLWEVWKVGVQHIWLFSKES